MERRTWETKEVIACSSHVTPGRANTPPLQYSKKVWSQAGTVKPPFRGHQAKPGPEALDGYIIIVYQITEIIFV
jgi:hypothetical protein